MGGSEARHRAIEQICRYTTPPEGLAESEALMHLDEPPRFIRSGDRMPCRSGTIRYDKRMKR